MQRLLRALIGVALLALAACTSPMSSDNADFKVTVETKTTHPEFGIGESIGYTINGVQGMELTLMRGHTYTFGIDAPGHPFYLTTDANGGPGAPGEITTGVMGSETQNGTLTFTPGASTPNLIYYQCAVHLDMGYKIDVTG
jgi:hypothetical protein